MVVCQLFGGHIGMTSHGPVGFASLSAATIGEAIATFVEWEQVQSKTYSGYIEKTEAGFEVIIRDDTDDEVFAEFFFEAFVKAMEVLIAQLAGAEQSSTTVCFKSSLSERQQVLRQDLSSRLIFDCGYNKLIVPAPLWLSESPLHNQQLHEQNLQQCRLMLAQQTQGQGVEGIVNNILNKHFHDMVELGKPLAPPPTLQQICDLLHMTERTLIRKLKAQQTSYKQLLEQCRKAYAVKLLKNKGFAVAQIAQLLGYGEAGNFSRAFKKWFGQSPAEYRQNHPFS